MTGYHYDAQGNPMIFEYDGPDSLRKVLSQTPVHPIQSGGLDLKDLADQAALVEKIDQDIAVANNVMIDRASKAGIDVAHWQDSVRLMLRRHLNPHQRTILNEAQQAEETWRLTVLAGEMERRTLYEMQRMYHQLATPPPPRGDFAYDDDHPLGRPEWGRGY